MENKGLAGMELLYDKQLSGKPGSETIVRDPAGHVLKTISQKLPTSGQDVRLTLDGDIQYTAEKVLEKTLRETAGKWAVCHRHGPAHRRDLRHGQRHRQGVPRVRQGPGGRQEPRRDRRLRAGLDLQARHHLRRARRRDHHADEKFHLPPTLQVADRTINESHPRGYVDYDVREILQWSSNVGAVTIGMKMGKDGMVKWIDAYGFGKPTGVQFPGEAGGIVAPVEDWSDSSIGNIPMGQGIAVTALQMASAFSTVADNGVQVKPRLVKQVGKDIYHTTAADKHRVIPAKVAKEIRSYLTTAVDEGTGTKAQIPGYKVAGKTGTAEIALPNGGGYSEDRSTWPPSSAWCRPTTRGSSCSCAVDCRAVHLRRRHRGPAVRRSCASRCSTWRSPREPAAAAGASERRGRSARIRADEAERAGPRGRRRDGARRPGHRDPWPRLPHA